MNQPIVKRAAKAMLIISIGGFIVGNFALVAFPSEKPPYAVMSKQRTEKALQTSPEGAANDSYSRATTK